MQNASSETMILDGVAGFMIGHYFEIKKKFMKGVFLPFKFFGNATC